VVVCICVPEVPVIVSVLEPTAAVFATVSRMALLEVVGFVAKVAVTPEGKPKRERATFPEKPFCC
jgi:hypothetical protein